MNKNILKRLLRFTKPYAHLIILAFVCAFISVSCSLLVPVFIGDAVDLIVGPGQVSFSALPHILLLLGGTIVGYAVFGWLMSYFTNVITYRTVKDLRMQMFCKLNRVPLKYIDGKAHGDIISRVAGDIDQISEGLLQGATQLFTGVITILGTIFFMVRANIYVALVVIVLTPLSLFVASFIAKNSYKHFRSQMDTQGTLSGYIEEMVGNQKIVKGFSYEEESIRGFEQINQTLYAHGQKAQFFSSLSNPCTRFVNAVVYAAVGVAGALSAIGGYLTVGQISMFLSYANQYTKPFNEITAIISQLQSAFASAQRVFDVLDEPSETPDSPTALQLDSCNGEVALEHVSFSYLPERPLIEDLQLLVKPGNRIALVGPTGCGKTTLINLLMRFYDIRSGAILVDNHDIRNITRDSLRNNYGMVLQESWLFSGTIRENIAYGKPDATDEEIIAAAKAAHAHSFIRRLKDGYQTLVTDAGANLSQGQRQLLCIARVMLMNPAMLILDEATSNIDTRTEILVQKAFNKMMEGRTSFVVAHRLSTIREADMILVMKDGHIIEQGTHETLLQQNGFYKTLYESQFASAEQVS